MWKRSFIVDQCFCARDSFVEYAFVITILCLFTRKVISQGLFPSLTLYSVIGSHSNAFSS